MRDLREQFIEPSQRGMEFGGPPIRAQQPQAPVVPMDRWREADGALYKTYKFRKQEARNAFLMAVLEYETETEHNAEVTFDHEQVSLKLTTKDLNRVTELDKEFARFADTAFKDLVYSSQHGDTQL